MDSRNVGPVLADLAVQAGLRILGAIALWIVGRMLIGFVVNLIGRSLVRQRIDPTLGRYIASTITVVLNVLLVIAILNIFGVETTTFAALLAAAGVAIGLAWSGLLGNFAAGAFLVVLRPFKVGDFVTVGGVTGTVEEVGLFVITLDTPDNVRTYVGTTRSSPTPSRTSRPIPTGASTWWPSSTTASIRPARFGSSRSAWLEFPT